MNDRTRLELLEKVAEAAREYLAAVGHSNASIPLIDAIDALGAAPATVEGEMVKTVQIATHFDAGDGSYQPVTITTALRSDGSIWERAHHGEWARLPDIPTLPEIAGNVEGVR